MNAMPTPILYVSDVAASAAFYEKLLGRPPVESSPGFAMFTFEGGALGLWRREHVEPAVAAPPGGSELAWRLPDRDGVDRCHRRWVECGARPLQAPTLMDFGYTFAVQDPDGHRLRGFAENV